MTTPWPAEPKQQDFSSYVVTSVARDRTVRTASVLIYEDPDAPANDVRTGRRPRWEYLYDLLRGVVVGNVPNLDRAARSIDEDLHTGSAVAVVDVDSNDIAVVTVTRTRMRLTINRPENFGPGPREPKIGLRIIDYSQRPPTRGARLLNPDAAGQFPKPKSSAESKPTKRRRS